MRFTGEYGARARLKKAKDSNNNINIYDIDIPPEITPYMKEYLEYWHPILIKKAEDNLNQALAEVRGNSKQAEAIRAKQREASATSNMFLSSRGRQYSCTGFNTWFQKGVYQRTGKRVNIHLTRHGFGTVTCEKTGRSDLVAKVLNNTTAMVDKVYNRMTAQRAAKQLEALLSNSPNTDNSDRVMNSSDKLNIIIKNLREAGMSDEKIMGRLLAME
jgi:hypothetical protein